MSDTIQFKVWGDPIALKRHRSTKAGHQYDPSSGDKADFLAMAMAHRPDEPFEQPIQVTIVAEFARPKRHFGRKRKMVYLRDDAEVYCVKTPDADNLIKFIGDALNGIFWADDRFIVDVRCVKRYAKNPNVEVTIQTL